MKKEDRQLIPVDAHVIVEIFPAKQLSPRKSNNVSLAKQIADNAD